MTQGPDLDEEVARGETFESREPGRFGAAGWTEKAGMPQFRTRERTRGGTQDNPAKIKEKSGKRTSGLAGVLDSNGELGDDPGLREVSGPDDTRSTVQDRLPGPTHK